MKSLRRTSTPIVLAMLLMVVVVLSACGNAAPRSTATDPASNTSAETTATATSGNTLEAIKSAGVLKVGLMGTYAPYNFLNANKEVDGFDADIAKEVAKRLGVKAEFTTQAFSGLIPSLQAGKFDAIISQVTITDERKQQLDFSDPYITNQVKIIVNANNTDITKLADFKDKNIGVGLGTNDETYLRTEVLPQVGNFNIKTYNDVITSLQDLNVGRIDATINNIYALKPIVEENGFKIKAVGDAIKSDQAGIAIRKDNSDLLKALNKALTDMKADGTYETIFVKWFGEKPAAE